MILSDLKIKQLVKESNLIQPFDQSKVQAVSYDFTSSNIIRVFDRYRKGIDLKDLGDTNRFSEEYDMINGYEMLPGEYILVKLNERINMPNNIAGHIRPRTTYTKLGLILSNQHINPGYSGYLFVGLRNATQTSIKIYPNIELGQFIFEEISGDVSEDLLYQNKKNAKYQNEDNYIAPKLREELSPRLQSKYDEIMRELSGE